MVTAMMAAPFAAVSLEGFAGKLADLRKQVKAVRDRIYYGDLLPPVGSQQLSYARFMQLLTMKQVKRVTLMADGQIALVEIPVEGWASDFASAKYDRADPRIIYAEERPEWQMEKYRFYCELPGDIWEDGYFMQLIKMNQVHRNADGRRDYSNLLREGQVTTELAVIDPSDAYVWLNEYSEQFLPIAGLLALRLLVGVGSWLAAKFGKKKKSRMEEMAEQYGRARAKAFNVGESQRQTGVRFADVAGIDVIKDEVRVVMDMLLGAKEYKDIGAQPFRGVLLEGPPGTGKTHLAKAMAGEAGIPFFSSNGAEFVEMFAGVAAARIRDLFAQARAFAPSIIFIDEVDAIGKARGLGGGDSGTAEREQGLLQLLCEMDGFRQNDRVLVIGATNMASALDDALLRPGRFDRKIYMGHPSEQNRLRILQVHARDKPIDRTDDDAVLKKVAGMTTGFAGADLANLLNEAAILAVRKNSDTIGLPIIEEAIVRIVQGLSEPPLPDSLAKRRMAAVQAGRATVLALTPGVPAIRQVTILPRGGGICRIDYQPLEFGTEGDDWHRLFYEADKPDDPRAGRGPMGTFDFCCGLLVPLYAARATEVMLFGTEGATLATANEVARAGDLAHWLVRSSTLHPAFRGTTLLWDMRMGGYPDPTVRRLEKQFEGFTVALQRAAYRRALALVAARRPVIETVAEELLDGSRQETVSGERVTELLREMPPVDVDHDFRAPLYGDASLDELVGDAVLELPSEGEVGFRENGGAGASGSVAFRRPEHAAQQNMQLARDQLARAAQVAAGQLSMEDLSESGGARRTDLVLEQAAEFRRQQEERAAAVERYATSDDGVPFPPPPPVPEYAGPGVEDWVRAYVPDVVEV